MATDTPITNEIEAKEATETKALKQASASGQRTLPESLQTTPTQLDEAHQASAVVDLVFPSVKKRGRYSSRTPSPTAQRSCKRPNASGKPAAEVLTVDKLKQPALFKQEPSSKADMPLLNDSSAQEENDENRDTWNKEKDGSNTTCSPEEPVLLDTNGNNIRIFEEFGTHFKGLQYETASPAKSLQIGKAATFFSPRIITTNGAALGCNERLDSPMMSKLIACPFRSPNFGTPGLLGACTLKSSPALFSASKQREQTSSVQTVPEFIDDNEDECESDKENGDDDDVEKVDFSRFFKEVVKETQSPEKKVVRYIKFICTPREDNKGDSGRSSPFDYNGQLQIKLEESELAEQKTEPTNDKVLMELWRSIEHKYAPDPDYYRYQSLKEHMRCIVVNWMMEVSHEIGLHRQTFQYALNYLDRFYSRTLHIDDDLHQIIACVCMFVAAKKEEIQPPLIPRMWELCLAPLLTYNQFKAIEVCMMERLRWELTPPTYYSWVCLYMRRAAKQYPELFSVPCERPADELSVHPETFIQPKFKEDLFQDMMTLLDIFAHLSQSLIWPFSVAAACAFQLVIGEYLNEAEYSTEKIHQIVAKCTCYEQTDIGSCLAIMSNRVYGRKGFNLNRYFGCDNYENAQETADKKKLLEQHMQLDYPELPEEIGNLESHAVDPITNTIDGDDYNLSCRQQSAC